MTTLIDTAMNSEDIRLARTWAAFYRQRGFNPLPSGEDGHPPCRYAQWWEQKAPADLFDRHPTTNIQLMTGRAWRLLVLDLDGPDARDAFDAMTRRHGAPLPPTWVTHSGGDGIHLWFRLSAGLAREIPKAILWRGEGKHSLIERFGDRSLIKVPPSIHRNGNRYRFLGRSHSPARLPLPAPCPRWVLDLKPIEKPRAEPPTLPMRSTPVVVTGGHRYRADEVLDAIGDKVGLAAQWGLKVAARQANHSGWVSCHAVGREDRNPSASISAITGRYWEPGERTISLFELSTRLGAYLSWQDAVNDLGRRFRAREAV